MSTDVHAKATRHETERDELAFNYAEGVTHLPVNPHNVWMEIRDGYLAGFEAGIAAEKKRSQGLVEAVKTATGQWCIKPECGCWLCEALEKYRGEG